MTRPLSLLLGLVVALSCLVEIAPAQDKQIPAKKKRVLLITESKGVVPQVLQHPKKMGGLCLVEEAFVKLANKSGLFDVACSQSSREAITPENLKAYDAVWFDISGTLPLTEKQKTELLAFVKSGKGFGACGSAVASFESWPEYAQLLGAATDGFVEKGKVDVIVEDSKHPATKHLGKGFSITDDIYQFKAPYSRKDLHVLLKLDATKIKGQRPDNDYAVAWTHEFGKGRVFCTALGHRAETWKDARFQQHILGGLQYILFADAAVEKSNAIKKD